METELWPNMLHYSHRRGCRVLLANARLSPRSAAGYARFTNATRAMLKNLDAVAAQSAADAERFRRLGVAPTLVEVSGSIKFDIDVSEVMRAQAAELRTAWGVAKRPTILAASTHDGEEAIILEAFASVRQRYPAALLLLAPRHPERFGTVQHICDEAGWSTVHRSSGQSPEPDTDVLLIDTLGELFQLFGVADVAVIGGSFIQRGGHNPLEAAAWGKPILSGTSTFNFAAISDALCDADALRLCGDSAHLSQELVLLLGDDEEHARRASAAERVVKENRGALHILLRSVDRLLR